MKKNKVEKTTFGGNKLYNQYLSQQIKTIIQHDKHVLKPQSLASKSVGGSGCDSWGLNSQKRPLNPRDKPPLSVSPHPSILPVSGHLHHCFWRHCSPQLTPPPLILLGVLWWWLESGWLAWAPRASPVFSSMWVYSDTPPH